ncbi:MAG: hypothetical protein Unbinned706contig1001_7 [Prokaryotic dsDNA virus sp.]|nr:MAG: hypothetical protein Unbinned706contig1001_7 [Prokaryotic dsDNA virus sp.]|tara:strand:- start:10563 stop:10739 length:177 start_codon:yes stop_codon:yes gene_type:complete
MGIKTKIETQKDYDDLKEYIKYLEELRDENPRFLKSPDNIQDYIDVYNSYLEEYDNKL